GTVRFFHAQDGIRRLRGTGVQTCALPTSPLELIELARNSVATAGPSGSSSRSGTVPMAFMCASPEAITTLVRPLEVIEGTSFARDRKSGVQGTTDGSRTWWSRRHKRRGLR